MADQLLRDKKGVVIGKICTTNKGLLEIKDAKGVYKGAYDPKTNKTKDAKGTMIGSGNLLTTLL